MEWNKISDSKPKQGGVYLCCNNDDILICGYWPHMKYEWAELDSNKPFKLTHWMLLPDKPSSQDEETPPPRLIGHQTLFELVVKDDCNKCVFNEHCKENKDAYNLCDFLSFVDLWAELDEVK